MQEKQFRFELSEQEKDYLRKLAWLSIKKQFEPETEIPEPLTEKLGQHLGAFVTLKKNDMLRGCIGHVVGDKPVWETLKEMAIQAAFNDPRFPPLKKEELDEIEIEISILSPITECNDIQAIQPGRHGLVIQKGIHSGLLLPQVATEFNWDKETFLSQTCLKAGLPSNCWKNKDVQILWFEAEVF